VIGRPLTLSGWQADAVREALLMVRGFIRGRMAGHQVTSDIREALVMIERAYGALQPATAYHDRGAAARCSFCDRYTADIRALSSNLANYAPCDCGQDGGWSGSFKEPVADAKWSIGERYIVGGP